MVHVFLIIAPLFLIILASAFLQRFASIGEDWSHVLNEYALKVGLPVLIFSALSKTPLSFAEQAPLVIVNSLFSIAVFAVALFVGLLAQFSKQTMRTFLICLMFGNIAYLGIPVLTRVYGAGILPVISVIVAVYFVWIFTIGTGYLEAGQQHGRDGLIKQTVLRLVKNPLLIAVAAGAVWAGFSLPTPSVIAQALDMVSASVTPTVLIVIGLFIGKSKLGTLREWIPVVLFSFTTLMILPASLYASLMLFGILPHQFSTSVIEAAMPLAITPFALAETYNLNKSFISRSIVLSTALSVFSLPFWISIL